MFESIWAFAVMTLERSASLTSFLAHPLRLHCGITQTRFIHHSPIHPSPNNIQFQHTSDHLTVMLFGGKDVLYGKNLTAALTDLAGTFLVFCFAIYFTVGGYCLYRELAING